jgi:hypothetical protein
MLKMSNTDNAQRVLRVSTVSFFSVVIIVEPRQAQNSQLHRHRSILNALLFRGQKRDVGAARVFLFP